MQKKNDELFILKAVLIAGMVIFAGGLLYAAGDTPENTNISQPQSTGNRSIAGTDTHNAMDTARNEMIKNLIYGILFVILLGVAAYYSRKIIPKLTAYQGRHIRIIETAPLGPRRSICLVQVGQNKKLLIGCTNENINILADVTELPKETVETEC